MRRTSVLLFLFFFLAHPVYAENVHKCPVAPFTSDKSIKEGYDFRQLTDAEKKHFVNFIKKTEGEPPEGIDDFQKYDARYVTFRAIHGPNGVMATNKASVIFIADQCVQYRFVGANDLIQHIFAGKWRLIAIPEPIPPAL